MCRNNPVEIVIFELVLENGPNGPPYFDLRIVFRTAVSVDGL